MSPRLIFEQLARTKADGDIEKLEFTDGVNAIVGPQNTGKSTWLRMLDFLMGDDATAANKFDGVLVQKYRAVSALMRLGDSVIELERTWNEDGNRSQTCLNGARIRFEEVQDVFLDGLKIPHLRYPQGNIIGSDRTWPTLGWRSLLRHIYRRQDHWSDLVPLQPESEQHACLLQFLGLAEHLFSSDLSSLTDKRKRLAQLEARREYLMELLHKLVPDLMPEGEAATEITTDTIAAASSRIESEIASLIAERTQVTARVRAESQIPDGRLNALLEERTGFFNNRDSLRRELSSLHSRVEELEQYKTSLQRELVRLERTDAAAGILENLKVTHCPACDQSVEAKSRSADSCFLCGQITLDDEANTEAASRRLKFERDQVTAELAEADELVQVALAEKWQKVATIGNVEKQLREIEHTLRPFQAKAAAVVPEELALIDQRIGTLHGRRQTIEALQGQLETGAQLTSEIAQLQAEIKELESRVSKREGRVDFDEAGNRLSEGFNAYLDAIRGADDKSWTKTGAVSVSISERRTQLAIGGRPAKPQLGGTLTIYFVFAYHYALLNLSRYSDCHYPGVTILDFYPDIARENALGDRLHLVLSPFVQLSQDKNIEPIQVIATSRALPKRPHINYIHLTEPWR